MSSTPFRRRALAVELPVPQARGAAARATAARVSRTRALVAITPAAPRDLALLSLRAFRMPVHWTASLSGLFGGLASGPDVLVLGDPFAGVEAVRLLAMIRTAGYTAPVVVIGHAGRALRARAAALAPLTLVPDPACADAARGEPWLRRCVRACLGADRR